MFTTIIILPLIVNGIVYSDYYYYLRNEKNSSLTIIKVTTIGNKLSKTRIRSKVLSDFVHRNIFHLNRNICLYHTAVYACGSFLWIKPEKQFPILIIKFNRLKYRDEMAYISCSSRTCINMINSHQDRQMYLYLLGL